MKLTLLRLFVLFTSVIISTSITPPEALATCTDPGCSSSGGPWCSSVSYGSVCESDPMSGGNLKRKEVDNSLCGNSCGGAEPFCTWSTYWTAECGTCCDGGGGNQTPVGWHDEYAGSQPPANCRAFGWGVDPDDRNADVNIRILSDGASVWSGVANVARGDLTSYCPGGTCSFSVDLNGRITTGVNHTITAQAQDINDSSWYNLLGTPKTLNCTAVNNASCISNNIPGTMQTNETRAVSVTVNNNGDTTWTAASNYKLGSQDPQDNMVWGLSSVNLPATTNPGQNITFNFNITAPSTPGTYSSRWRMFQKGVEWFGATCGPGTVTVNAAAPPESCTINIQNLSVDQGSATTMAASTSEANGTISQVTFSSSNTGVATATSPDNSSPFSSTITGVFLGLSNITARGFMSGVERCSDTAAVTVNPPGCDVGVTLSTNPLIGTAPLNNVDLTGDVSGSISGNIRYRFDCTNDGTYEHDVVNSSDPYTADNLCNYASAGNYTAYVRVDRGGCSASDTATVSVGGAPVCSTPTPRDPPAPSCDSGGGNGQITWRWDAVVGANEYEIDIYNSGGTRIINNDWQSAASFGCAGGGTCSYTTNHSAGSYYSQVRARGACAAGGWSTSNTVTVNTCGGPTLSVILTPNPSSGAPPLNNINLTGDVSGTATGNIRYRFDCTNDGTYEHDVTNSSDPYTASNLCSYASAGTYTARVRVDRESINASDNATITVTGGAGVCNTPAPRDPPASSCDPPGAGDGSITWAWDAVWDADAPGWATQYDLDIQRLNGSWSTYIDYPWRLASFYGCDGGGVCTYTTALPVGTYRSRIRTQGVCGPSAFATSPQEVVSSCGSCTIDSVPDVTVAVDETASVFATVSTGGGGTVGQVEFSSNNTSVAIMTPSDPFIDPDNITGMGVAQGTIRGVSVGNTNVNVVATLTDGITTCNSSSLVNPNNGDVTVTPPNPWWQTIGGDILSAAEITSKIPSTCASSPVCEEFLNRELTDNPSLFPGVTTYYSILVPYFRSGDLTRDANESWLTNTLSSFSSTLRYDYSYFFDKIPAAVTPLSVAGPISGTLSGATPDANGYEWYTNSGGLTINNLTINAGQRVVLFVDGNLTLAGDIDFANEATSFFMTAVDGAMDVANPAANPPTQTLNGLFVANQFNASAGSSQLVVNGSVASWGGVTLNRDIATRNATEPAELFNFRPDYVLRCPQELLKRGGLWREISP